MPESNPPPAVVRFREFTVPAVAGGDLLFTLLDHDVPIMYLCMGGSCRTCRVQVISGHEHLEPKGELESLHTLKADERLACQTVLKGTGEVVIDQE
jgi:ferredoxin-NAD(P)+ reductase (naphthalene dioxygenase ferredoxin-specific)